MRWFEQHRQEWIGESQATAQKISKEAQEVITVSPDEPSI